MSKNVYEKHFTADQLSNMKASTIRDLKDTEESATIMLAVMYGAIFFELIVLVATILWTNKFAIFVSIVGLMFIALFGGLARFLIKQLKKKIQFYKEGLDESYKTI